MDRIDPLFFVNSSRINIKDETRIKATSEEVANWESENRNPSGWLCFSVSQSKYLLMKDSTGTQLHFRNIFPYHRYNSSRVYQNYLDIHYSWENT